LVSRLTYTSLEDYKKIFRIGIFLAYIESDMSVWEDFRDNLRKNYFTSAFLVKDYLSDSYFKDNRDKSFFFLRDCHVAFFIVEKDVGSGGVVSELEEYKREVYPEKQKKAVLFEHCSFVKGRIVDSPSTVIAPNLTEDKFDVRRFIDRQELFSMSVGVANQLIYKACKSPYTILDPPTYRLACQICKTKESRYMCLERCKKNCRIYHICKNCANSDKIRSCTQNGKSLYEL